MRYTFWMVLFTLWTGLLSAVHIDQVPVLYEGRFRPLGTIPKEERDIKKLPLLPPKKGDQWLLLSTIESGNPTAYTEGAIADIRAAESPKKVAKALIEGYGSLAKSRYKQGVGKGLNYPSKNQLRAELFLYNLPFKWFLIGGYLIASFCFIFRKSRFGWAFLLPTFLLHTAVLGLRCWILGRPPISNMSETILYVPWILLLVSFLFTKQRWMLPSSLWVSSLLLFFLPAHQKFENVQAVLDSQYWLIVHVMLVVASYGIFFLSGICGHVYLIQKRPSLEKILIHTMYWGTALLMLGTILGGIWAAQSWGRFWDWDPKESWAFISCGIYLLWIHAYRLKKIGGRGLAIGSIIGLMAITFTWYGVNYLLGVGLHSYGFGAGGELFYFLYLLGEVFFLLTTLAIKNILYKNYVIEKKDQKR